MTDPRIPVPGPLDHGPHWTVCAQSIEQLTYALDRITLGIYDRQVRDDVVGRLDPGGIAAVASWLRRTFDAGVAAGRRERVDETDRVQRLEADVALMRSEVERLRGQVEDLMEAQA